MMSIITNSLLLAAALVICVILSSGAAPSFVDALSVGFNNGSTLVLQEKYFVGEFPNMAELFPFQPNPNKSFTFRMSLVTPFSGKCPMPSYIAQGENCDYLYYNSPAYHTNQNADGSGIELDFFTIQNNTQFQAVLNIICDPRRESLYTMSKSFNVTQPGNTVISSFKMASKGACLPVAPTPPPPTPNHGRKIYFNNGSFITLNNFFFTANFGWMEQTGVAPGKDNIAMSLVTPTHFDNPCLNSSYISMNKCVGVQFNGAPLFVVANNEGTGLKFLFQSYSQASGVTWLAHVNVICDPRRRVLTSPSNSYEASATTQKFILNWNVTSRGACINQN